MLKIDDSAAGLAILILHLTNILSCDVFVALLQIDEHVIS